MQISYSGLQMGRKANRLGYIIYDISGSTFTPVEAATTDLDDGESIRVMTATLMRNVWPR